MRAMWGIGSGARRCCGRKARKTHQARQADRDDPVRPHPNALAATKLPQFASRTHANVQFKSNIRRIIGDVAQEYCQMAEPVMVIVLMAFMNAAYSELNRQAGGQQ